MSAELLLSRLDLVKRTKADCWSARCPAHEDRGPSLSIREIDDGRILVHCFAGCSAHEVVSAVGLSLSDLMAPRALHLERLPGERRPFPAIDVLRGVAFEGLVVLTAAAEMLAGEPLDTFDRGRLALAVGRIQTALRYAEGAK